MPWANCSTAKSLEALTQRCQGEAQASKSKADLPFQHVYETARSHKTLWGHSYGQHSGDGPYTTLAAEGHEINRGPPRAGED